MNINDVLRILTYVFFTLAAISLITSIILFFKLRIKEVIQMQNLILILYLLKILFTLIHQSLFKGEGIICI